MEEARLSLAVFCCFWRNNLPFLFFFCKLGSRGKGRGGRGGLGGSKVCGASLDEDPFLLATRSFRPLLKFKAICSSSLELVSTQAITSLGEWAAENLSSSTLKFKSSTGLSSTLSSFSKRNWSISASRERREEAVSSLGIATSRGEHWRGNSTDRRSLRAKNPSTETSIRANLGSLTLIAWPASWYIFYRGS